jgi:two-component system, chemotaxis family, chemotaxis protein CheY
MKAAVSPRSRSVLIVDDDRDVRDAMAELLQDEGYECLQAKNGLEALAVLKLARPGLLLVDLIMPIMNGVDFLARLRQDPCLRDIPVIAMTAANDRMVGVKLDGPVLHKPIDLTLLSQMLAQYYPFAPHPAEAGSGAPR